MPIDPPPADDVVRVVREALAEDLGPGDLTAALVPESARCLARVITREACVLAGRPYAARVFHEIDPQVRLSWSAEDGTELPAQATVLEAEGRARSLLSAERTALNLLQCLSGTATATHRFVVAIAGTGCRILDTRKTLPGLRLAQKYAVRCGGGTNHRLGLYDGILIKENHIAAAGSIAAAVAAARSRAPGTPVEVEVESLAELEQAFAANADMVLLDELPLATLAQAVARNRARAQPLQLEASGGIGLDTVRAVAETGVDFISIGGITKHVRAVDLSMRCTLL
jgi:nicotinate-nucleotide pyrophosphorylase (carboxylating)